MHQSVHVALVGHTDTTGVEGTNLVFSQQRADSIAALLLRSGSSGGLAAPPGVGTTQPLRAEDTEEGRQPQPQRHVRGFVGARRQRRRKRRGSGRVHLD